MPFAFMAVISLCRERYPQVTSEARRMAAGRICEMINGIMKRK